VGEGTWEAGPSAAPAPGAPPSLPADQSHVTILPPPPAEPAPAADKPNVAPPQKNVPKTAPPSGNSGLPRDDTTKTSAPQTLQAAGNTDEICESGEATQGANDRRPVPLVAEQPRVVNLPSPPAGSAPATSIVVNSTDEGCQGDRSSPAKDDVKDGWVWVSSPQ